MHKTHQKYILVQKNHFQNFDSFWNFLDNMEISFELGKLPEGYLWCQSPSAYGVYVNIRIYHKDHDDILLCEYNCDGIYRILSHFLAKNDKTKKLDEGKYITSILPYDIRENIFDNWKDENYVFDIFIYKARISEILCYYDNVDKSLFKYINDDLIILSVIPKNNIIHIDPNMIIEL